MLAHDIRGALQGVIGGVATVDRETLPSEAREQFDRIANACHSLAGLISIRLGGEDVRTDRLDFSRFIPYVDRRWRGEAQAKGIGFEIDCGRNLPAGLDLTHIMMVRLVGNLLSNAIKHTASGTVRMTVTCHDAGGVEIRVTDTGPGIPQAVADQVMQSSCNDLGLETAIHGIGLHIVRNLTESHGGTFALRNRPEGGADITVRFPVERNLYEPREAAVTAVPSTPAGKAQAAEDTHGLAGLHVLLAEDNPTNQMVASQMLRALGITCEICSDGVEALEKFETGTFDLVIVDIEMPRLSGLDVIRRIRARSDARRSVPIVALTAYALREHRDKIAEAGANGLISKPIISIEVLGNGLVSLVPWLRKDAAASPKPATAPEPETGSDEAEIDLVVYDALAEAIGPEMMDELLEKVVTDLESSGQNLSNGLDPLDLASIGSASHILISVGGAIGAARLQTIARQVNIASHNPADSDITPKVRECIREIDAAVRFAKGKRNAG